MPPGCIILTSAGYGWFVSSAPGWSFLCMLFSVFLEQFLLYVGRNELI